MVLPASATRSARRRVAPGSPDVMSMTTVPGRRVASISSNAVPTAVLVGSMVITTSLRPASSARPAGVRPPTCWAKLSACARRASATCNAKPAPTSRAAIGQPMLPMPTKPTASALGASIPG